MTSKLILARRFHFHSDLWKRSAKAATSAIQNSCREIYYRKDITGNLFSNSGSVTSSAKLDFHITYKIIKNISHLQIIFSLAIKERGENR